MLGPSELLQYRICGSMVGHLIIRGDSETPVRTGADDDRLRRSHGGVSSRKIRLTRAVNVATMAPLEDGPDSARGARAPRRPDEDPPRAGGALGGLAGRADVDIPSPEERQVPLRCLADGPGRQGSLRSLDRSQGSLSDAREGDEPGRDAGGR